MFNLLLTICLFSFSLTSSANPLTDPTRPADTNFTPKSNAQIKKSNSYHLSQIYINNQMKMAVINGRRLKVGDIIGNAKITHITLNKVFLLINNGHKKTLMMSPSIKQYHH